MLGSATLQAILLMHGYPPGRQALIHKKRAKADVDRGPMRAKPRGAMSTSRNFGLACLVRGLPAALSLSSPLPILPESEYV